MPPVVAAIRLNGEKKMSDLKCKLCIGNLDEWVQHLEDVARSKDGKTEEDLLNEAFAFDFVFRLIEQ